VVRERGINLRGSGQQIQAVYNPNLASAGMSRAATPTVIEVRPLAMSSSDELARTLSHELNHARSWLKGGVAPESTAYAAEDALSAWLAGLR
jgi:tRNA A37 threonylcarbamoyladenosine dehydratase